MEESTEANNANIPLQYTERLYSSLRGTDRYFDFAPTGNGPFRPWKEIRELKNHDDDFVDDDFVDDDRKWDTVPCASAVNKFRRRGVVDDAKHSRVTSSCSPQASAGITPCF